MLSVGHQFWCMLGTFHLHLLCVPADGALQVLALSHVWVRGHKGQRGRGICSLSSVPAVLQPGSHSHWSPGVSEIALALACQPTVAAASACASPFGLGMGPGHSVVLGPECAVCLLTILAPPLSPVPYRLWPADPTCRFILNGFFYV